MKVTEIEVHRITLPYVDWISYQLNHYYGPISRTIYVAHTDDGLVGLALALLLQDGFAEQVSGHLLGLWKVVGVGELPIVIDRTVDGQTLLAPKMIVVHAVPGRNVHKAGAGAVVDKVVTGKEFRSLVDEWMTIFQGTNGIARQ